MTWRLARNTSTIGATVSTTCTIVGPVTAVTLRSRNIDPTRYLFVGRVALARGPLYSITDAIDEGTRVRILRRAHPAIVLTLAPPDDHGEHPDRP